MMSFSGVTFVLICFVFRLYAFVEAAALRSTVLRYAGAPIATRVSLFFPVYLEMSLFPSICFCTISAFSLYGEYVVRSFLPDGLVFFYLVTTGWIFYISLLCENSTNQSKAVVSHKQRIGCQPQKLLYTVVANPARGLLNRRQKIKKSGRARPLLTLLARRK